MNRFEPDSTEELQDIVKSSPRLTIAGQGTKQPAHPPTSSHSILSMARFNQVLEYDPSEFTITAQAGTLVREVQQTLAQHGQFLPFDPALAQRGASIGGMVAAGITGPSRLRFGGIRDFILGIKLIDGLGELATAGGKVVKNAAGFDLPKMFVGSWGRFGPLTEVTFKVFPQPSHYQTLLWKADSISQALLWMNRILQCPLELDAVDLQLLPHQVDLLVRIGGDERSTPAASLRLQQLLDAPTTTLPPDQEPNAWLPLSEWSWHPPKSSLIRIPLTPKQIPPLDNFLAFHRASRRYSLAGNLAWIAWPDDVPFDPLHSYCYQFSLIGRCLSGTHAYESIGPSQPNPFADRVIAAIDPHRKWSSEP